MFSVEAGRITRMLESRLDNKYGAYLKPRGLDRFVWEVHDTTTHEYLVTLRLTTLQMLFCHQIDDSRLWRFIQPKLVKRASKADFCADV